MIPPRIKTTYADTHEWSAADAESIMMDAVRTVARMGFEVRDPCSGDPVEEFWIKPMSPLECLAMCANGESDD